MNEMVCPFCSDESKLDRLIIYKTIFCYLLRITNYDIRFFSHDKKMRFDYYPDKAKEDRFSNALAIVPLPKSKALTNSRTDTTMKIIHVCYLFTKLYRWLPEYLANLYSIQ